MMSEHGSVLGYKYIACLVWPGLKMKSIFSLSMKQGSN
jgi:hypothetical protein